MNTCAIIPFYNHPDTIARVAEQILSQGLTCIIVDDGSDAPCSHILNALATDPNVIVLKHALNQGKGAAVITGLKEAHNRHFTHALQIDADGQHDGSQAPALIEYSRQSPRSIIAGAPIFGKDVPKVRLIGRYATHIWVWINTLSFSIKDTMCGFRVYPVNAVLKVIDSVSEFGKRMDFDIEIMVRSYWAGIPIVQIPVQVIYPLDGISHFKALSDNILITKLHTKLFFGMLIRSPILIGRKLFR